LKQKFQTLNQLQTYSQILPNIGKYCDYVNQFASYLSSVTYMEMYGQISYSCVSPYIRALVYGTLAYVPHSMSQVAYVKCIIVTKNRR